MALEHRIEPLMLNNKLAIVRINLAMDVIDANTSAIAVLNARVFQDVQAPASSYTALTTDAVLLMTTGTATLYESTGNTANEVYVKNIGTGQVNINATSGTIDGASSVQLTKQYVGVRLYPDGANWYIL
jgi:hypothetical protein